MRSPRKTIGFARMGVMLWLGVGVVPAGTLHVIALSGQPVPGGGGVFSGKNSGLGMTAPALNNRGVVSFSGSMDDAKPGGTGYAVFCGGPGTVIVVARAGQSPPALGGAQFSLFQWFSKVGINDAGAVAFGAVLSPEIGQSAILKSGSSANGLALHARTGSTGSWEGSLLLHINREPTINALGQTAFYSELAGTNGGSSDNAVILRGNASGSGLTLIAQKGDPLPAGGETFEPYSGVPALNEAGQVAFLATTSKDSNARAVLRGEGGSLTLMARTGTVVPGLGTISGFGYSGEVTICNDGDVILPVSVSGGADTLIRADESGVPKVIVSIGNAVSDHPGTLRGIDRHVAVNGDGLVAFNGWITTPDFNVVSAIFRGTSAVAASGQKVPGEGVTFLAMDGEPVAINAAGQVAFRARLSDDKRGIFLSDPEDGLRTIAMTGQQFLGSSFDTLEFAGSSPVNGVLGKDRNGLNDNGEVAFRFELADGREGVAMWSVLPKPEGR